MAAILPRIPAGGVCGTRCREARMDPGLLVIVPHHLPARAAMLNEALAGTSIRVIIDRRRGERRQSQQPVSVQRRQRDRRGATPRVVAFVYACPVIAVGTAPTNAMLSGFPRGAFGFSPHLETTGIRP